MLNPSPSWRARSVAGAAAVVLAAAGVLVATAPASALPAQFTVLNGGNNATDGSLGDRIAEANANGNPTETDLIVFDMAAIGAPLITLTEALPAITQPLTITGPGIGVLEITRAGGSIFTSDPGIPITLTVTDLELRPTARPARSTASMRMASRPSSPRIYSCMTSAESECSARTTRQR